MSHGTGHEEVQGPKSKVQSLRTDRQASGRRRDGTPGRDTLFHREKPGEIGDRPSSTAFGLDPSSADGRERRMGRDTFVRVQCPKSKVFGPIGRQWVGGGTGTPGRDTLFHREKPGEIGDHAPSLTAFGPDPSAAGGREKDGTGHVCFESKVQSPRSKVFGPIGQASGRRRDPTRRRDTGTGHFVSPRKAPGKWAISPSSTAFGLDPSAAGGREKDGTGHVGTGPATGHRMAGGSGHFDSIG
jgi:hypothetical protein